MHQRCTNKNREDYVYYGGRGITICSQWDDFEQFLKDMGRCSKGLTLERIDVNKNYGPDNCKWATWTEQQNNKRPILECPKGHAFTPENTYLHVASGKRQCRTCKRVREAA